MVGNLHLKYIYVLMILAISFVARAEETADRDPAAAKEKSYFALCKNGKAVRTIRIDLNGSSCVATYTKEGVDQVVGKSGTSAICHEVFDKIRTNLEAGNWKCKDVKKDRLSMSVGEG